MARRRPPRRVREGALDARRRRPAWLARGRAARGRTRRRRERRFARPGLRLLRRRARARRACSAAASSRARSPDVGASRRRRRESAAACGAAQLESVGAGRRIRRGNGGDIEKHTSSAPMRAGRRSTIWCSARCSTPAGSAAIAAADARSAAASSKSASAPAFRCRLSRAPRDSSASICPSRCCARRRSASTSSARQCRGAGGDGRRAPGACPTILRRGGRAICHHRRARSGSDARRVLRASSSRAARSCWSITSARRAGRAAVREWLRADRARARLAAGIPLRARSPTGPSATAACAWSSVARCRRSGISR